MRFCRLILSFSLLLAGGAPILRAATPDDMYLDSYRLLQQGDSLSAAGQKEQARQRYQEALENLEKLKSSYPQYNKIAVEYRLNYLKQQAAALPEPAKPAPVQTAPRTGGTAPREPSADLQNRVAQLESENQLLQAKLQEALSARPAAVDPRSLAEAEERIKQLEKEKELLRASLEKAEAAQPQAADKAMLEQARGELESTRAKLAESVASIAALTQELQQLRSTAAAAPEPKASAPANNENNAARVQQLEAERDNLQKKLDDATKQLKEAKPRAQSTAPAEASEIANLRARLQIFESRKVPYTAEELAVLDQSGPGPRSFSNVEPRDGKRSVRELPSGSGMLIAEAERAFAARRFPEAEAKYLEVLEMDRDNSATLANLAAIQLEMGKLPEAESNLKRALSSTPDDPYALLLMGMVRFRQENFQEALDLLSRSAQLDPKNAEAQNYIGITLSQLGQREAAETALRKAISLKPNYPGAHHNLAFIYATQKPPVPELAKFHYNKALAIGHPRNPDLEKELNLVEN